jgi:MFS family permease
MLAQAANFGDLSKGKAMLFDLTREFMKDRYGAAAGRILGTNLFLLSIVSFAAAVRSDPSETLRYWSGIVAAGSSLALSSIGLLFAKYEAALAFRLCTGALGVVGGIASFILSVSEVAEAREDRESARMWLSIAAAAGSAMLTVGFLITAIGAGTSWTGVGLVLVLAGVVISIVASVTMLIMALLTQRSEETFKGLRREFAAEGGAYDTEYRPISDLAQAYRDVVDAGNRMSWCAFSWRAIVPLYCMGFSVRNDLGAEDLVATAKGLEALIDNESDSGSHKTIARFLLSYRQAVKNPSLDADRSGVADVFEWQKGTIYPERSPAPIPVG